MTQTNLVKPSKKIVSLGIIVLAAIASAVFFKLPTEETPGLETNGTDVVRSATTRGVFSQIDTDSDGLSDWEELLWKTDPKNSDSDGDGTGDLAEIQQQKDTQAAFQEQLAASSTDSYFSFWEQNKNLSRTDALSRALFEQAVTLENSGMPLSAKDAASIAETLGSVLVTAPEIDENPVTLADLTTIAEATEEQIHTYGNDVAGALKVETSEQNNEFFALIEFMQTGNPASLAKLAPVINHYKGVVEKLKKVPVPKEAAQAHLSLANRLLTTATILERLMNLSEDSVAVVPVLQKYQSNYEASVAALHDIKVYLDREGVVYESFEDGYLLVTVY